MIIKNHMLLGAISKPTPNVSGFIDPKFVVMHYTAGYTASSAINTLCNPNSKVSAHIVLDRDGTIYQLAPFNRKTWHAGPSKWMGYNGMNSHSIGIEIVHPGYFKMEGGKMKDAYGNIIDASKQKVYDVANAVKAPNRKVGSGTYIWPPYTQKQIEVLDQIFLAITKAYNIKDVTGHEDIDTRGWKTDPGPSFPMPRYKNMLHVGSMRADPVDVEPTQTQSIMKTVNADVLNVRAKPSILSSKVSTLKKGQKVWTTSTKDGWSKIQLPSLQEGWVASRYLA